MRCAGISVLPLALAACMGEPRAPDGRVAQGGASVFIEPTGASALLFAGAISPLAYDYEAMAAGGALGCAKEPSGAGLGRSARLVDAGKLSIATPRAPAFAVPFDAGAGAHVAAASAPLFSPGDPIDARSGGSIDAPPFALRVRAPDAIALATPLAGSAIERGRDLDLAWAPADGFVDVIVESAARTWSCVFPASRGAGTVEAVLLTDEPAGRLVLRTAAIHAASAEVSGWHVSMAVASQRAITPLALR